MKTKRLTEMEAYIQRHGSATMDELRNAFDVSMNTVRRDVAELLKTGSIEKVYGGVRAANQNVIQAAYPKSGGAKRAICFEAARLVKDGDIVFIDSGNILKEMRKGNCALLPIGGIGEETGGFKGYGFNTIVEILSAALAGGPHTKALSGKDADGNNCMYRLGHFFFVINPEFFMGLDTFKSTSGDICRTLRNSTKAPGAERIYTAGEKEWLAWQDRKDKGVPVGETIQKEFMQLRDECGLDYKFPFEG